MNEDYMKATYIGTVDRLSEREGDVTFDSGMMAWLFRPHGEREWYRVTFNNLIFDRPDTEVAELKKKFGLSGVLMTRQLRLSSNGNTARVS